MRKYQQPDFYHFSEDSIELVKFISKKSLSFDSIIDFCAGCGVIGIELLDKYPKIKRLDFIELQKNYHPYIKLNLEEHFVSTSIFSKIPHLSRKYDLVVMNPPYFNTSKSRSSSNPKKDLCRRISQENYDLLYRGIKGLMHNHSNAFVLDMYDQFSHSYIDANFKIIDEKWLSSNLRALQLTLNV